MPRNTLSKALYGIVLVFILSGIVGACSKTNEESSNPNNNQNDVENNVNHHLNENPNGLESNQQLDREVENNIDAAHDNHSNDVDDASDDIDKVDPPETATPQTSAVELEAPDENTRPTLRSPVDSDDDPRTLVIGMLNMSGQARHETSFREAYTRMFEWAHPNVEIEFTSVTHESFLQQDPFAIDTTDELRKLITGDYPPDVLFLGYNDYLALMEEDLLVALNPFFVDSELSLDDFEPIVADGLVSPQDGQTYGLSPYFTANALIYNKDLFDEMNVPYPRDHMTWEEVFTLAKQMTFKRGDDHVYGLMFDIRNYRIPTMHELWKRYIHSSGAQLYDKETRKITVNDDDTWVNIFASLKDLYDAGVFPSDPSEGNRYPGSNKFYSNTIAMGIVEYYEIRQIIDETIAGQITIPNWDIVSIPVHPEMPHVGAGVVMEPVIAINANGRNQLDAWRLIESIHSSEWANASAETYINWLSSRKDHAANLAELDYNKAAFYQLRPAENYEPVSTYFGLVDAYQAYLTGANSSLQKLFLGNLEIKEALEQWEMLASDRINKLDSKAEK